MKKGILEFPPSEDGYAAFSQFELGEGDLTVEFKFNLDTVCRRRDRKRSRPCGAFRAYPHRHSR